MQTDFCCGTGHAHYEASDPTRVGQKGPGSLQAGLQTHYRMEHTLHVSGMLQQLQMPPKLSSSCAYHSAMHPPCIIPYLHSSTGGVSERTIRRTSRRTCPGSTCHQQSLHMARPACLHVAGTQGLAMQLPTRVHA